MDRVQILNTQNAVANDRKRRANIGTIQFNIFLKEISMICSSRFLAFFLLSVCFVSSLSAEIAVTPAALANEEGVRLDRNGDPRPRGPWVNEPSRAQFIHNSSIFSSVVSGPVRITEINLRPDGPVAVGATLGFDNLRLVFAVTSDSPEERAATFEENLASVVSESVVTYDQPWESTVVNAVPSEGTRPFDFKIELTDPFEFDPSDGHLIVDWFFGLPTNPDTRFDSYSVLGEPNPYIFELQGLYGVSDRTPGSASTVPTQFVFESVPEPAFGSVTALLILGLASRFRQKR